MSVSVKQVRPRARHKVVFDELKVGDKVMVNYNYDDACARGYWYDSMVTRVQNSRTVKQLYATVFIG